MLKLIERSPPTHHHHYHHQKKIRPVPKFRNKDSVAVAEVVRPKSSVCISSRQGLLSPGLSKASFPRKERYGYNNLPTNDLQSPSHYNLPRNYRQMIKGKSVFFCRLESWFIKQGLITNGPRMVGGRETCGVSSCETAFIYYSANWGHPQLQI